MQSWEIKVTHNIHCTHAYKCQRGGVLRFSLRSFLRHTHELSERNSPEASSAQMLFSTECSVVYMTTAVPLVILHSYVIFHFAIGWLWS